MTVWIWAGLAAAFAGFSRGFAAFGTALIFVPLMTLAFDAETAVVTLFLIDLIPAAPLVWKAMGQCKRPVMLPMAAGAAALSPVGLALLVTLPPPRMELIIGLLLVGATTALLFGGRLRLRGGPGQSLAAGAASGLLGGLSGIFGPPAMIYLLARQDDAASTRANATLFMTIESLILGASYIATGMVTAPRLWLALALAPVYGAALWLGAHSFARSSEALYRRLVLGLLGLIAAVMILRAGL